MRYCLNLDDFSIFNNRLDLLLRLKKRYPGFKVSLFTIPYDIKYQEGDREKVLNQIIKHLDWMQIIPHGLYHNGSEMKHMDYFRFKNRVIPKIKMYFDGFGLPYVNGFKAPHWNWSEGVVDALDDLGWWGAISPARPKMRVPKRFYTYDFALDEKFWESKHDLVRIHGHLGSTNNDLEKCMDNMFKIPLEAEWHYVTDFIEEKHETV